MMGGLGSDVLCVACIRYTLGRTNIHVPGKVLHANATHSVAQCHQDMFPCSRSRFPLIFFLRPYLTICMFSISIDTRGVDKSPRWGPGTRGVLG